MPELTLPIHRVSDVLGYPMGPEQLFEKKDSNGCISGETMQKLYDLRKKW